ncbi:MAG: polysaccharide lyase family 1 protein [Phycisphaerae bacterium]
MKRAFVLVSLSLSAWWIAASVVPGEMREASAQQAQTAPAGSRPTQDKPEGFGASAKGGEGGKVITVTSLADSGPCTLREAIAQKGPRIIQFGVEGDIELKSRLACTEGRITIDGSTAPGKGITLVNHGLRFLNCEDIVVRHLRVRVTTGGASGDGILFWGKDGKKAGTALVDHCSFMGATDEIVNTWGQVQDVTFQWCIIAEGKPPHNKAWLSGVGSDRITIHHCLLAGCEDRNPKLEGGLYDFANNVVCGWGNNNATKVRLGAGVNIVGNTYIPGKASAPQKGCVFIEDPPKEAKLYVSGNISPLTPASGGPEDQWTIVTLNEKVDGKWVERRPAPDVHRAGKPFDAPSVTTQPAARACQLVLDRAGAAVRDEADLRVIKGVRDRLIAATSRPARN